MKIGTPYQTVIFLLFGGLFNPLLAEENNCGSALECYERAFQLIKNEYDKIQDFRAELVAVQSVLRNSIILSEKECGILGEGWISYAEATGRYVQIASSEIYSGDTGGENSFTLTTENLPNHIHDYKDIYHAEDASHEQMPNVRDKYTGGFELMIGSEGTDNDNEAGAQLQRKTIPMQNAPIAVEIAPEFIALNACQYAPN